MNTQTTIERTPTALKILADRAWHKAWCDRVYGPDLCDCGLAESLATIEDEARGLQWDDMVAQGYRRQGSARGDSGDLVRQSADPLRLGHRTIARGGPIMSDLEAIRARHERCTSDWCIHREMGGVTAVGCDTMTALADRDRWRADAERLAMVLGASVEDCALDDDERLCWAHGAAWPSLDDGCEWAIARDHVLGAHEAMDETREIS